MKNILGIIFLSVLAIVVVTTMFAFSTKTTRVSAKSPASENTQLQIEFLEGVVSSYPRYFDAQIELTRLYLLEGKLDQAKLSLDRAKAIDPNSKSVKNFEEILSGLN